MTAAVTMPMTTGADQFSPAERALGEARRAAEHAHRHVAFAYTNHAIPERRVHPLAWTISRDWTAALRAVAAARTLPEKAGAWRAGEKRMKEIGALDKPALAEAVAEQEREIEAIGAATVASIPPAPPPPSEAAELIADLRRRGVSLFPIGGTILAHPAGLLMRADIDEMRRHKAELLRLLARDFVEV